MTDSGAPWTPQDVLWELGTSFVDAAAKNAARTIEDAIERVGTLLTATAAGVWRMDHSTGLGENLYNWTAPTTTGFGAGSQVAPDPAVGAAVQANGGLAIVDLELVVGRELCEDRGWVGGEALVAVVHEARHETTVLVIGAAGASWNADELELIRGTVLLLRQFHRRVQAEQHLLERHQLDQLTVTLAARFQTTSPETIDEEVDRSLVEVRTMMKAGAVVLIDVLDDHTVAIPNMIAEHSLPAEWATVPVPDVSVIPGCEGMTIYDFVSEPRVMDIADLVDALMGPEMSEGLGLRKPPRTVALLPASLRDGHALLAITRPADEEFQPQEFDALSTIASLIAQTRGRVAAEVASRDLLNAQRALAAAGRTFLNATAETSPTAIHDTLASMGGHLNADLSAVFTVEADATSMMFDHLWLEVPVPQLEIGAILDLGAFPIVDRLLVEETTHVAGMASDFVASLDDSPDREWCGVVAPIRGPGMQRQYLAFGWMSSQIRDVEGAIGLATAAADLIGQLHVRLRAEEEITLRLRVDETLSSLADEFLGVAMGDADAAMLTAFANFGTGLGLGGLALRKVVDRTLHVEAVWAPAGKPRPLVGSELSFSGDVSLESVVHYAWDPSADYADVVESNWGPGTRVYAVPVVINGEAESLLSVATTRDLADSEVEAIRSLAAMLGHLRARLAEERRSLRRHDNQRLLGLCARDLAEASPDDFEDRLVTTLELAAKFAGLDAIVYWQVDHIHGRYIRRASWIDPTQGVAPSDYADFGTRALLDDVRASGEVQEDIVDAPTAADPTRIAVPRADGASADHILMGLTSQPGPFTDEVRELLASLSQTMQEVGARIAAERYSHAAFEGAPIGVVLRDELLNLITCNQAFVDFVGAGSVEELVGTAPQFVYDDVYETVDWVQELNGQLTGEAAFRGPNGSRVWGQMRASVVTGGSGESFWLIHIEDVTERRRSEQLLRFQASHDELTGLANRRRLLEEIHRVADGSGSVGVLLLDLDRFKNINDSLGHDRGDELLVVIADRLRLAVRPGDLVARLGGDEFAVVLPGPVDVEDAEFVAERLLRLIGDPVTLGRQKIYPTASIGIAVADATTEVDDLLRRADTAMYRAKAEGRARAESFDEKLRDAVQARMETEAGLRDALRNDGLLVHYQPEVSLHDGRMLGAEALVRWDHPEQGILPAAAFIEIAEETGLVVEMGEIVLAEACREAMTWAGGDDGPMIRVNLAAAQIQREETVTLVRSVLAETGLPAHRLCLEITESAVMADVNRSEEVLRRLKMLGVHLAVDDFGTGFSSLAYLKRFPVDALKIDRAFVKDLDHDTEDVAFVRSIVSLAEALGLDVVAEGVETEVQAQILLELGCHRAQGYFFARPGPPEALLDHLARLV